MNRREDKLIWESMRGKPPPRRESGDLDWENPTFPRPKFPGKSGPGKIEWEKDGPNKPFPRRKPGQKEHKKTIPRKRDKIPPEWKSRTKRRDVNEAPEPPNFAVAKARVLEGVNCSCKDCVHWVEGDLCGAQEISLSKVPNDDYGAVVICETFEAGRSTVKEDSDEELRRVDPEGAAFMDAIDRFKQLILKGHHQEARDMTELFRVDFNTEWENAKPELAEWLVVDGGLDGASASELLDRDVNDHGDIVGDEAPW